MTSKAAVKIDLKHTASSGHSSEEEDVEMEGLAEEERAQPISPSKRRNVLTRENALMGNGQSGPGDDVLADQAQTWRQLEELIEALDALDKWSEVAEEVEK